MRGRNGLYALPASPRASHLRPMRYQATSTPSTRNTGTTRYSFIPIVRSIWLSMRPGCRPPEFDTVFPAGLPRPRQSSWLKSSGSLNTTIHWYNREVIPVNAKHIPHVFEKAKSETDEGPSKRQKKAPEGESSSTIPPAMRVNRVSYLRELTQQRTVANQ